MDNLLATLGAFLVWGLRLSMVGLCLYGALTRKFFLIRIGLSGLAGSIIGWGGIYMLVDFTIGFLVTAFGLVMMWFVNPGMLTLLRRRRGSWIQINDKKIWVPRGKGVDVSIEFTINPPSPVTKIQKSILPKKGEDEEKYKDRMR